MPRERRANCCCATRACSAARVGVVTSVALAISALLEFDRVGCGGGTGSGASGFLGTQGDPWDTQTDMAMAWIGAMAAQLLLARWRQRPTRRPGHAAALKRPTPVAASRVEPGARRQHPVGGLGDAMPALGRGIGPGPLAKRTIGHAD